MNKFFSRELADKVGYGIAVQLSAIATDLRSELDRAAVKQQALGLPKFYRQEASDEAELRRMMDEGPGFDLDVEEWATEY